MVVDGVVRLVPEGLGVVVAIGANRPQAIHRHAHFSYRPVVVVVVVAAVVVAAVVVLHGKRVADPVRPAAEGATHLEVALRKFLSIVATEAG